ncbi:MAG: hypothetical protein Q9218_004274 [Villophora microphyllina]
MRLLNTRTRRLSQFFDEQRPPYAILSHTWGMEEVSMQDLEELHKQFEIEDLHGDSLQSPPASSSVSSRAGWRKIEASYDQALHDRLSWIWVDTCCIDKTSSAELSEGINSMFAWYKGSTVCYAFLSDVDAAAEDVFASKSAFSASRWFTRGWTLQELLAPRRLGFFNSSWQAISQPTSRSRLFELISEITRVPTAYLQGLDVREATIGMRMSWASRRATTRKEDVAYCLLGIFDINMPLLYGEGMKAFSRLQKEIMKRTFDNTILAWGFLTWDQRNQSSDTEDCGVLATSPADFAYSGTLGLCPRFASSPSRDMQMTNEGLRLQVQLRAPRNNAQRRTRRYVAVLDCFSRQDPSKRLAIPLRKTEPPGGYRGTKVGDGDVFIRASQTLVFSDITPNAPPNGYMHIPRTIRIAKEKDIRAYRSSFPESSASIDLPRNYSCEVN